MAKPVTMLVKMLVAITVCFCVLCPGVAVPWLPISEFPWSAYREAEFGHGSFETLNNSVALWTYVHTI